ncbi:MAG TPA: hypothetical protein VHB97_05725 [Polyangia bacterium]|nr:hypothetical protein [Polyangia bacterium]
MLSLLVARATGAQEPAPALPSAAELYQRLRAVEEQNAKMARELGLLRGDVQSLEQRHQALSSKVSGRIGGYADIGFFYVGGDGSGIRPDTGHVAFPEYSDVPDSWVFYGDPLAPTINSRGDVATTGPSRAVTYNPVDNGGKPSFIVNALTLSLFGALGPSLTVNGLVDFLPRNRNVSDPTGIYLGDYVDVKLVYVEYTVPTDRFDLRISVGKIDSTLGIEYRTQESPDRITGTPSLICRTTCGRPTGIKVRGRFFGDLLVAALAVTNGSNVTEQFPFSDEIDVNNFKTVSGRLSTKLPVGAGLELGASGAFGAQDLQPSDSVYQWHVGGDLHLDIRGVDLRGEFVSGSADGRSSGAGTLLIACGAAPCLHYKGAYGQVAYRVLNWLMPYVRVDWRDAFHRSGDSFVYITDLMRVTGGVRLELGEHVIVKAEYTYVRELGRVPQFPDDVFTSSLVVKL